MNPQAAWWSPPPPPPPRVSQPARAAEDGKVRCSSGTCNRWAWTSKLPLYRNTCLCGSAFSNLPFVEEAQEPRKGKGKGRGPSQDFAAQLEALIQAQPESASARAAQALLAASASDAAARQGKPHTTQQVTEVSAKVQRAQSTFDKLQKSQAKLVADMEKNKGLLQGAATALAEAEQERAVLFKAMLPKAKEAKPNGEAPAPMIDLSAMLTSGNLDDSMISLNLGAEFDSSDGVMSQGEMEELERRKDAVKKALVETMKSAFGTLNDNLKEHRESLSALREKNAKKRKASPGPEAAVGQGDDSSSYSRWRSLSLLLALINCL